VEETFDHIDDLIGKVLANEATPEEQSEVDRWLLLSEDNRKYFEHVKTIFDRASASSIQMKFDADIAWNKVRKKLSHKGKAVRLEPNRNMIWRIAAGILLIIGVSYAVYELSAPAPQVAQAASGSTTLQDTLPDGSTAFLNKKSEVHFEYDARQKTRKVTLKGEAFFEVKHEEEKPFVIQTDEVLIKDLGTAFNVKAYPESKTVEVIVESGEVHIYTLKNPGIDIRAGETGVYDKSLKEFTKVMKADTNVLAYKTRVFSFNNTDLGSIVSMLNEVYGSKISLSNPMLSNCHITVNFNNEPIETVVEVLAETLNIKVTRNQDQIILEGTGCQ
jgi:ferric-dicitrate binding protein FerR (iron transport regulator)